MEKNQAANQPVDCETCGRTFAGSYNLSQHMICHTGDLKYQCGRCGKKFGWKSNLMQHRSKKIRCKKVDFVKGCLPIGKETKKIPPAKVAQEKTPSPKHKETRGNREFICQRCGSKFMYEESFQRHLAIRVLCAEQMKKLEPRQKKSASGEKQPQQKKSASGEKQPQQKKSASGEKPNPPPPAAVTSLKEPRQKKSASGEKQPQQKKSASGEKQPQQKKSASGEKQPQQKKSASGEKPNPPPPAAVTSLKCFKCGDSPGCKSNLVERFKPQQLGLRYICPPCDHHLERSGDLTSYFTNAYYLLNEGKKKQQSEKNVANKLKRPISSSLSDGHKKVRTDGEQAVERQQTNSDHNISTSMKPPMSSSDAHKIHTGVKKLSLNLVSFYAKKYSCPECGKKFMHEQSFQYHQSIKNICLKVQKRQQKKI